MSDNSESVKQNLLPMDGFDNTEEGVEGEGAQQPSTQRIIQGDRLAFSNDFIWLLGGDEEFPKDRELVPVDTLRLIQKWLDKMPAGHVIVEAGHKWPNVDALNEACPKSEWAKDFNGVLRGPWQRQRVVYFVDLNTMQKYSWSVPVDTVGADICIREFRDKVAMMRKFRGERVFAVVTLGDTFMPTRFGGRQRPDFVVKRWVLLGSSGTVLPAPSAPSLPAQAPPEQSVKPVDPQSGIQSVKPPSLSEQMGGDEVPFNDPLSESVGGAPMPAPKTAAPPSHKPAVQKPQITKRGVTKIAHAR